jgi:hypothetical protein
MQLKITIVCFDYGETFLTSYRPVLKIKIRLFDSNVIEFFNSS